MKNPLHAIGVQQNHVGFLTGDACADFLIEGADPSRVDPGEF
jgi:hypothetical protein